MESIVIGDLPSTGHCEIDIDLTVSLWSELWGIYQWNDEYRIVKHKRKDSPETSIKMSISEDQAEVLIKVLGLHPDRNTGFTSATTWKTKQS